MRRPLLACVLVLAASCAPEDTVPAQGFNDMFLAVDIVPSPVDSIGDSSSFGSIDDAVTVTDDGVVVVDGMNGVVHLIRTGVEVDRVGGIGDGPREFRLIRKAIHIGGDSVLVLDRGRRRLVLLEAGRDSLRWIWDEVLPFSAEDLCVVGERLYAAGTHEGKILHEIALDGGIIASFAPVEGEDPLSQALSGTGTLACSTEAHALAFGSLTLGVVRIFSEDGHESRRDSIPGFVRTVYEVSGVSVRPALPEQGYAHTIAGMAWMGDELLVQLSRGWRLDDVRRESQMWRADATWVTDLPEWPLVLEQRTDGSLLTAVEDPYPRILIYQVR